MNTLQGAAAASGGAVAQGAAIAPAGGEAAAPAQQANQVQGLQRSALLNEPVSFSSSSLSRSISTTKTIRCG